MNYLAGNTLDTIDSSPSAIKFRSLKPAQPTIVYDSYWRLAVERQAIFFKRLNQEQAPWTEDPILRRHKFTNAYRASDRVSQYLIKNVIYTGEQCGDEIFFRTLLFKFFNRIGTWELLSSELGDISFKTYDFQKYDSILTKAMDKKQKIFSSAYIMPSGGPSSTTERKHRLYLLLLERMMKERLPSRLEQARSLRQVFELLRSYSPLGDFLAYQYTVDLNYSPLINFSENDFVMPGPGARSGIRKCFSSLGGLNETEIIHLVTERQQEEFKRLGIQFQALWGRELQLIDCQNLFCEVDKYARVQHPEFSGLTGRTRIKQTFSPQITSLRPWYPPKWGINDAVSLQFQGR